ncbi:hypothetical protein [Mycobacterium sp. Marseille-P9652]|uniref:hypothetical protein n=1 Tax=Mycobacterium sp. Marseille-P9652 TaxID=2654950 RepID=UPI0012E71DA1|nr:hypothetical protein [Mycobacterium sp. Marseille-P9652]
MIPVDSALDPALTPPALTLQFAADGAIEVSDPSTAAIVASVGPNQVTATPATYKCILDEGFESPPKKLYTQALLLLQVPGMPSLRIGTSPLRDAVWSGQQFRYAWRGRPTRSSTQGPTHLVIEADWIALVERLGLGARIADEYASGALDRRERLAKVYGLALIAVFLAVVAALLVWLIVYLTR